MDRYTISDLEKLTGIMAGTIRIWERRYHIIKPHRTDTNRRWYDDDDLRRILNIAILNRNGFKISKIVAMSDREIIESVEKLTGESTDSGNQADSLVIAMTGLDENAVDRIIMRSVINRGFEETFTEVVFPLLNRVGIMWQTGTVDVGTEHFISNIFRKRLIAAIDSLPPADNLKRMKILLYLPENELHELGLLFYAFIARKEGHDTLYLGQATPFDALSDMITRWHPDIIVTGSLTGLPFDSPENYLDRISSTFSDKKILVSGTLAMTLVTRSSPNIFAIASSNDFRKHL